jgi:hypothetical protein
MSYLNSRESTSEQGAISRQAGGESLPTSPSDERASAGEKGSEKNEVSGSNARAHEQKPKSSAHRQTPDELVRKAEQKYLAAIALLSRDASRQQSRLDPEALAQFDQALAAVDRTIIGTRRAVRAHPNDPVAVQYMLTAYAKKVEVLRQMVNN